MYKTGNVLDKIRKLKVTCMMPGWQKLKKKLNKLSISLLININQAKYPKAVESPKDRETLLTFYDFPAYIPSILELLTPVESTREPVRLRTRNTVIAVPE